jgi:hypothetical protein
MAIFPQEMVDSLFDRTRAQALDDLQTEYDAAASSAARDRIKRAMMFIAGPILPEPADGSVSRPILPCVD